MKKFFYITLIIFFSSVSASAQVDLSSITTPQFQNHIEGTCLATVAIVEQKSEVHSITRKEAKKWNKHKIYLITFNEGKNWDFYGPVEGDQMLAFHDQFYYCVNKNAWIKSYEQAKKERSGMSTGTALVIGSAAGVGGTLIVKNNPKIFSGIFTPKQ